MFLNVPLLAQPHQNGLPASPDGVRAVKLGVKHMPLDAVAGSQNQGRTQAESRGSETSGDADFLTVLEAQRAVLDSPPEPDTQVIAKTEPPEVDEETDIMQMSEPKRDRDIQPDAGLVEQRIVMGPEHPNRRSGDALPNRNGDSVFEKGTPRAVPDDRIAPKVAVKHMSESTQAVIQPVQRHIASPLGSMSLASAKPDQMAVGFTDDQKTTMPVPNVRHEVPLPTQRAPAVALQMNEWGSKHESRPSMPSQHPEMARIETTVSAKSVPLVTTVSSLAIQQTLVQAPPALPAQRDLPLREIQQGQERTIRSGDQKTETNTAQLSASTPKPVVPTAGLPLTFTAQRLAVIKEEHAAVSAIAPQDDAAFVTHQSAASHVTPAGTMAAPRNYAPQVAAQIGQAVVHSSGGTTEIALNPEELGRVRISLTNSESGLSVSILAERPETADLMRRNIDSLAREFLDLGHENLSFSFGDDAPRDETAEDTAPVKVAQSQEDGQSPDAVQSHTVALRGGLDLKL